MAQRSLKLKQASAVLKVQPKELQNLVQFGVVKPRRVDGAYFFNREALLSAKVAIRLKASLGTRAGVLAKLIDVFRASEKKLRRENPVYVIFTCRFSADEDPIRLEVPFRSLGEQIEQGLSRADLYRDMPRGRKRAGWRKEFLKTLSEAAKDIGEISEEEIQRTIRSYREQRRMPEITVAAGSQEKKTARRRGHERCGGGHLRFPGAICSGAGSERGPDAPLGERGALYLALHGRDSRGIQGSAEPPACAVGCDRNSH
jgi:hypothetical protein